MKGKIIRWFGPVYTGRVNKMPGIFHGEHRAEVEDEIMWGEKSLDVIRARVVSDGTYKGVKIFVHKKQVEIVQ